MDKRLFDDGYTNILAELDRLHEIINTPERILGEFYDPYRPNLLQQFFAFSGHSEDELYDVIIEQLSKLPVLSDCRIIKTGGGPTAPLKINYRAPDYSLFFIDIRAKKYENVFDSVVRGMSSNISDADARLQRAKSNVDEIRTLDRNIRQIADGDLELRAWGKKGQIRKYLATLTYSKEQVESIVRDIKGYLGSCQKEMDKRQAALAVSEREYARCCNLKSDYDNNPFLQNAIQDLTDLMHNSGYTQRSSIYEDTHGS